MPDRKTDWQRLREPFPASDLEWRPGATTRDKKKAIALAYLTARAVQERLDDVFGPAGWKNEFREAPDGGVLCRIYFRDDAGEWVWREDGAANTEIEAVKGGLSGALKRAASALGVGRYLYSLPTVWVRLDDRGRFAETPTVPASFLPGGGDAPERPAARPAPKKAARQRPARRRQDAPRPRPEPESGGDAGDALGAVQELQRALRAGHWTNAGLVAMLGDQFGAKEIGELNPVQVREATNGARDPALRDRYVSRSRKKAPEEANA